MNKDRDEAIEVWWKAHREAQEAGNSEVEVYPPYDTLDQSVVGAGAHYLSKLGINLDTEHTRMTAYRLSHYLTYLNDGELPYHCTTFRNENPTLNHMVVVPRIPFWSACSHHCLPFIGEVSVGYIPNKLLIGLSKIPLIVRSIATGFWMQEHLANTIADRLEEALEPQGLAVCIRAQHMCQLLDLKQPPIPVMVTPILRGILMHGEAARNEFYSLIDFGGV